MAGGMKSFTVSYGFVVCIIYSVLGNPSEEIQLHQDLFNQNRYNRHVRPVLQRNESVFVKFHKFHLYCIMDLDEKSQVMKTSGWLTISWRDQLLTWNSSEYDGIKQTLISQDNVWKPDIVINNAVDTVSKTMGFSELAVNILDDGTVMWEPGDVFQTLCTVDVSRFPFDTQVCKYEFSTWMYSRKDINLTVEESRVDMSFYQENGEWEVIKTEGESFDINYEPYAGAIYRLTLKRRRGVYILNIIVPIILLSFLNSFVFILPAESGEKTALCVTSMLSFMVYLSSIVDMVPKTSLNVPLIVVYLVLMLSFSAISVIFTVIVIFTYQRKNSRIPGCLHCLISCRRGVNQSTEDDLLDPLADTKHGSEPLQTDRSIKQNRNCSKSHLNLNSGTFRYMDGNQGNSMYWRMAAETLDRTFFYCVFILSTLISVSTLCLLATQ